MKGWLELNYHALFFVIFLIKMSFTPVPVSVGSMKCKTFHNNASLKELTELNFEENLPQIHKKPTKIILQKYYLDTNFAQAPILCKSTD